MSCHAAVYEFLTPSTSRYDRPIVGASDSDPTGGYTPLSIPTSDTIDLRGSAEPAESPAPHVDPPLLGPASNQWAVDHSRGAGGHAWLANDPHLGLRVPSIFYRSELEWPGGVVRGVGIPGLPGILIGANAELAWGATVSNADQADWVVVEPDPADANRYRTPEGFEAFGTHTVDVAVAGRAQPEHVTVQTTRWGPIVAHDGRGRPLALHASVARAARRESGRARARARNQRRRRNLDARALGRAVAELDAGRQRRRHRLDRERPAAAARRLRRLAPRILGRRQSCVGRRDRTAAAGRWPRRRAVHREQPHAAAGRRLPP